MAPTASAGIGGIGGGGCGNGDGPATATTSAPAAAIATAAKLDAMYAKFKQQFPEVPDVTPAELHAWQQDPVLAPQLVVVDIRTPAEQAVSVLPGPHTLTQREFEDAGPDAFVGRRVVCYCTAGYRSGLYARKLRREYGMDAANLRGSILAWTQAGLPLAQRGKAGGGGGGRKLARATGASAAAAPASDANADAAPTRRVHVFSRDWALQGDGYEPVVFSRPLLHLGLHALAEGWRALLRVLLGRGRRRQQQAGGGGGNAGLEEGPARKDD